MRERAAGQRLRCALEARHSTEPETKTAAKAAVFVFRGSEFCYYALRLPNKSPIIPMPSKAIVPGSGSETDTESSFKNPGSSRKAKLITVVAPVATPEKCSTWYGLAAGLVRLVRRVPPNDAEKKLGLPPSG